MQHDETIREHLDFLIDTDGVRFESSQSPSRELMVPECSFGVLVYELLLGVGHQWYPVFDRSGSRLRLRSGDRPDLPDRWVLLPLRLRLQMVDWEIEQQQAHGAPPERFVPFLESKVAAVRTAATTALGIP